MYTRMSHVQPLSCHGLLYHHVHQDGREDYNKKVVVHVTAVLTRQPLAVSDLEKVSTSLMKASDRDRKNSVPAWWRPLTETEMSRYLTKDSSFMTVSGLETLCSPSCSSSWGLLPWVFISVLMITVSVLFLILPLISWSRVSRPRYFKTPGWCAATCHVIHSHFSF